MAISAQFGGASHDAFVWKSSYERTYFHIRYSRGVRNEWLLGDSGYPLEPWLMTPYCWVKESDNSKTKFNEVHSKARSLVERCKGVYKIRWRIFSDERNPRYSATMVGKFANVCAALHNICIAYKVPLPAIPVRNISGRPSMVVTDDTNMLREAERIRDRIRDSLFI